jgi:tetratricopeptide (TPR) repeat protein
MIRMLDSLFQGDVSSAEQYNRIADRLRIQNTGRQLHEGGHLIWELQAHAMCGDITRVRQIGQDIAPLAKRYPQWLPVLRYALAEYYRMTHDYERAQKELAKILPGIAAGTHQIWSHAAASHVLALLDLGQPDSALQHAALYETAANSELEYVPDPLQLAIGLARAQARQPEAGQPIDRMIDRMIATGITGLRLTVAYEMRARIALQLRDMAAFAHYAELCSHSCFAYSNPALTAKHHRLLQEGRKRMAIGDSALDPVATLGLTRIELALRGCRDDEQRARLSLTLLTQQSGAKAGLLYLLGPAGPTCVARVGHTVDPQLLSESVQAYLHMEISASDLSRTLTDDSDPDEYAVTDGEGRVWRPMLLEDFRGGQLAIVGVAMLATAVGADFSHPRRTAAEIGEYYARRVP